MSSESTTAFESETDSEAAPETDAATEAEHAASDARIKQKIKRLPLDFLFYSSESIYFI